MSPNRLKRILTFAAICLALALAMSLCIRGVDPAMKAYCAWSGADKEQCAKEGM